MPVILSLIFAATQVSAQYMRWGDARRPRDNGVHAAPGNTGLRSTDYRQERDLYMKRVPMPRSSLPLWWYSNEKNANNSYQPTETEPNVKEGSANVHYGTVESPLPESRFGRSARTDTREQDMLAEYRLAKAKLLRDQGRFDEALHYEYLVALSATPHPSKIPSISAYEQIASDAYRTYARYIGGFGEREEDPEYEHRGNHHDGYSYA